MPPAAPAFEVHEANLHGHRAVYRTVGSGPTVVLIHGMINSSRHWETVAQRLAGSYRVIAPDLIGHGEAATPRGDYSLGAHAAAIRDLLTTIGVERATIVGHSLGGGVAMQFFYQFPQRTERLALISSGGLGTTSARCCAGRRCPARRRCCGWRPGPGWSAPWPPPAASSAHAAAASGVYLQAVARALGPLQDDGSRRAFLQTLRAVIDVQGQKVSARDRLYLLGEMPTLIAWGERDRTIPLAHGLEAAGSIPNCRFETLPKAAHFPNLEDPEGLADVARRLPRHHRPGPHRRLRVARRDRPAGPPAPRRLAIRLRRSPLRLPPATAPPAGSQCRSGR